MKRILTFVLLASLVFSNACNSTAKTNESPKKTHSTNISEKKKATMKKMEGKVLNDLQKLSKNENNLLILDVRTKEEYEEGHLKYAVSLPLSDIQKDTSILDEFKDKPIILYCRSGSRSGQAGNILLKAGFNDITNGGGVIDYKYELLKSYTNLTAKQFIEKSKGKNTLIIDIRAKKDYDKAHFKNAINIELKDLKSNLKKIPKDKTILVYSYTGYESIEFINNLINNGYNNIYNAIQGTNEYKYSF